MEGQMGGYTNTKTAHKNVFVGSFFLLSDDAVEIEGVEVLDHDQFTRFTIYSIRFVVFFFALAVLGGGMESIFQLDRTENIYYHRKRERER